MKRLFALLTLVALAITLNAQSKATQKADLKYKKGDYKQAAADYETLAKLAEKSKKAPPFDVSYVYNRLGNCYLISKEYAKAEDYFKKAQDKGVKDPLFLQNYGDVLLFNGKVDEALAKYQQYLSENPDSTGVLSRIRNAEYAQTSAENPNAKLDPVVPESKLNAINNQYALAWYQGSLLFSSDRGAVTGSKKPAPTHFFYAQPIFDFQQDRVSGWNPLQEMKNLKTPNPDHSFAYDNNSATYYVARCVESAKSKNCNIYALRADQKGKLNKPAEQSFHDNKGNIRHPALSSDGKVMFFTITKDKKSDIYVAKKTADNVWTAPQLLSSAINTAGDEGYPFVYRDSLLFFASDGHPGMGGMDIFCTKITVDGVGHAVSEKSDLTKLEFSEPINLQSPINSTADDYSVLIKHDGKGGFFISNRTTEGLNRNSIYSFAQEPYVFNEPGKYLVKRLPGGTSATTVVSAKTPVIKIDTVTVYQTKTDTVYLAGEGAENVVEKVVEKVVHDTVYVQEKSSKKGSKKGKDEAEKVTEVLKIDTLYVEKEVIKEVYVGDGDEKKLLEEREAQLQEKDAQIAQLSRDLEAAQQATTVYNQLGNVVDAMVKEHEATSQEEASPVYRAEPTPAPATTTNNAPKATGEKSYRVQIGAILNPAGDPNFVEVFRQLHKAMPNLRMETTYDNDGYARYVTIPFVTFAEADALRTKIKAQGVQCFVATYKGEKRISINVK